MIRSVCFDSITIIICDCHLHLQILVSEIDFFVSGENIIKELLKLKEEEGMYPPRFCVVISCSPIARQSQARIEFSGATKELLFDIPLNPLYATTYVASAGGIYMHDQ